MRDLAAEVEPQASRPLTDRARIVVADDQPDVRLALSLLFKLDGHEVEAVGSPRRSSMPRAAAPA